MQIGPILNKCFALKGGTAINLFREVHAAMTNADRRFLLERHHNDRFKALMDGFMPQWRLYQETLNRAPLAHEEWYY